MWRRPLLRRDHLSRRRCAHQDSVPGQRGRDDAHTDFLHLLSSPHLRPFLIRLKVVLRGPGICWGGHGPHRLCWEHRHHRVDGREDGGRRWRGHDGNRSPRYALQREKEERSRVRERPHTQTAHQRHTRTAALLGAGAVKARVGAGAIFSGPTGTPSAHSVELFRQHTQIVTATVRTMAMVTTAAAACSVGAECDSLPFLQFEGASHSLWCQSPLMNTHKGHTPVQHSGSGNAREHGPELYNSHRDVHPAGQDAVPAAFHPDGKHTRERDVRPQRHEHRPGGGEVDEDLSRPAQGQTHTNTHTRG